MSLEGAVVDLHHLVTILLHEHLYLDERFRHIRLEAVTQQPTSYVLQEYIPENDLSSPPTDVKSFHGTPDGSLQYLTGYDLETIFWRCKHYDDNLTIVRALQVLLNDLSASTKLRIRTALGFHMVCSAHSFTIIRNTMRLRERTYITTTIPAGSEKEPIAVKYCLGGSDGSEVSWIEILFEDDEQAHEDRYFSRDISLDIVSPMLGLRGHGGENFILELAEEYHETLASEATIADREYFPGQSTSYGTFKEQQHDYAEKLAEIVLNRLKRIHNGEESFCAHCGRPYASLTCPKSRDLQYCDITCLASSFPYHKRWCTKQRKESLKKSEWMKNF